MHSTFFANNLDELQSKINNYLHKERQEMALQELVEDGYINFPGGSLNLVDLDLK